MPISTTAEEYRARGERQWDLKSEYVFGNDDTNYAQIIFEIFLKKAAVRVVIFCEKLAECLYSDKDFLALVHAALLRGVEVDVVVQDEPESKPFLDAAKEWSQKLLPISIHQLESSDATSNFSVCDGRAYRYEADRNKHEASVCMFDQNTSKRLERIFWTLKSRAGKDLLAA